MKIFIRILSIIIILVGISFIYHSIHLSREEKLLTPLGEIVEVDHHNMSIYDTKKGDKTLVFLSGGGTCSPILDFKSLYTVLENDYRCVVVERFGYGFSDNVDLERSLDKVLEETRECLKLSGIPGPYILCPHSMSGLEAIYWAQKYPDEVKAIIGLDMAVPKVYEEYNINMPLIRLASLVSKVGLIRFIPNISESEAIRFGSLDDAEEEIYKALFHKKTANDTMLNEVKIIKDNAKLVENGPKPTCPMLLFISNGQGTGWDKEIWREILIGFSDEIEESSYILLDCPHYIQDYKYKLIGEEIKNFIK